MEIKDIYDVNEDLLKQLVRLKKVEGCSKEFEQTAANHAKVKYAVKLLDDHHQFRKLESKFKIQVNKNDEKSLEYRKGGNGYFSLKNKNYFEALQMYNKSICFAEKDSENLSIGYANRSAVLFEWKRYKECLENIKLARDANYPEKLMSKLNKREEKCLELLQTQGQEDDRVQHEFKLSYDPHKTIPFIADCLDMKYTKDLGRYIYTTKDLNPGDLVSIEKPFSTVLLPPMRYVRCANCYKENYLTLIPCPDCTCTMYCSQECMDEGFKMFHKYECPLIDLLHTIFNKIHLIALRTCLTALSLFDTIEECIEFCNNPENENQCAFTLDYNNFTKREHYRAIHGLVTNQDKRPVGDLFQRSIICAVLTKYFFSKTLLGDLLIDDSHREFFSDLLFRHIQTAPANMHSVALIEQKNETKDDQTFASASYVFGSLLNHSCAPNTVRIYQGTTQLIFVLRPIPANQPLFDNYGYHFATCPKATRQNNLKTQYSFICKCEACINEYPLYEDLTSPKDVPCEIKNKDILKLLSYNREYASENYESFFKFLKEYGQYYPCVQICSCEESVKMSLNILADAVPLKARLNI